MNTNTLLTFWGVSALFILTPGADWAYAITAGIRGRVVIPAVFGLLLGHALSTLLVATGIGAIVNGSPLLLQVLTAAGALYLLWLGIGLLKNPAELRHSSSLLTTTSQTRHWLVKGLCISGLNPKVFLLFFALLPQFIDLSSGFTVSTQILVLGMIHLATCSVIYYAVGFGSHALLKTRPHAAQRISQVSGALMIIIASLLLIDQSHHLV